MRHQEMPAAKHLEFDRLCRGLEDFEPLPARLSDQEGEGGGVSPRALDSSAAEPTGGSFDPLILAGLVNPV